MNLYEIVFSGQVIPGAQPERVQANLGKLFQADAQRVALLFSGRRLVLKNNLDLEAAQKYRSTLERAGALVELVSMQPLMEVVELAPPPDYPEPSPEPEPSRAAPASTGRLQLVPRDVYMAAFTAVDAPDFVLLETGSDLQDARPEPVAPHLDLSRLSLAPAGSDMGQVAKPLGGSAPDTSHLTLE
jgi:hypothetical protein